MATENLKVKITADASQAKAEIGKFKSTLKKTTSEAEGSNSKMSAFKESLNSVKAAAKDSMAAHSGLASSLGKVCVAAGAAVVALKAIKAAIGNAIDVAATGDAIKDNAQKVFLSTTAYQEWGYVLKQNGVDMSALKMGMRKFSQEVANGSPLLAQYGITATDVSTAFQQAIFAIQNMSSETDKIAAATELFGTRALELFPILNLTNQETQALMDTYRAMGGTMSNELIAASDICTDSITEMKVAWGGLRNLLASLIIPIIIRIVQWVTVAIAKIRILIAAILGVKETFGGKTGNSKRSLVGTSASVARNTGGTARNLKKAGKAAKELRRTLMGIDELTRLAEKATSSAASSGGSGVSGGGGGGSVGGVDVGDEGALDNILSEETLEKINKFREKIEDIKDKLHGVYLIFKGIGEILLGNPIQGFKDIKEGIELLCPWVTTLKEKWTEMKEKVTDKVATFKAVLEDKFTALKETVQTKWEEAKKKITDQTATIKAQIEDKFSSVKESVATKWEAAKKKFSGKSESIQLYISDKFSSILEKTKKAWDNAKKKFTDKKATITLAFTDKMKSLWNSVARKVQAARSKSAFAKKLLPNMPTLAKGGVLTSPTTAIMGEYAGARHNPEIATPQSLMYDTILAANGNLVSAFASMTRQVIAAIEEKDLSVSIGDEAIARSAQRGNTAYYNRTGKALLTV